MNDARKTDVSTKPGDEQIANASSKDVSNKPGDQQISDEELEMVSAGRASTGGYGTLDYGTMTCHGGD